MHTDAEETTAKGSQTNQGLQFAHKRAAGQTRLCLPFLAIILLARFSDRGHLITRGSILMYSIYA